MIASLSNKQKLTCNSPNYLIFSSAVNPSNRSSANRSTHEPYASAQSERNEADKVEPKMFKIRTFGGKAISAKQPRIQGKRIAQEAIACIKEDAQIRIIKCGYNNRRPSVQLSKEPKNEHSHRHRKQDGSIDSSIFKEIQLKQKPETYQMSFQYFDFTQYSSLSHRPNIWINNERPAQQNSTQTVIIFSLNIVNLDLKRIFKLRQKSYYSQRSVDGENQSSFTIDTQSILRNICGKSEKSFLNGSKVYFKVNGDPQLSDLREFLSNNQLKNYDGIIDVRGRYTQTHHFYSINEIISEGQKLIILEQQQTLRNQIPLIEDLEAMFITFSSKHLTYNNVNKAIKALKTCEIEVIKNGKNLHTYMDSSKKDISTFEDKENQHPNIVSKPLNRTYRQSKLASNKKTLKNNSVLYFNTVLKTLPFEFEWRILNSKVSQINGMKKIRQQLKESRNSFRQNVLHPLPSFSKLQKPKSRNKSIEVETSKQSRFSIQLQGDFKQKLMKYVKILESQRNSRQPSKESRSRERTQCKDDDLEELTASVTTRTKSKTPYQIVGDLIRNNMHIGKQVQKHVNKISNLRKVFEKTQQSFQENKQSNAKCIYTFQL